MFDDVGDGYQVRVVVHLGASCLSLQDICLHILHGSTVQQQANNDLEVDFRLIV